MAANALEILKMSRFCERFVFWNGYVCVVWLVSGTLQTQLSEAKNEVTEKRHKCKGVRDNPTEVCSVLMTNGVRGDQEKAWLRSEKEDKNASRYLLGSEGWLHVRRKHNHKHKRKPRVNRDDTSTSPRKRNAPLCLCLRRPGSHVACACAWYFGRTCKPALGML